jgi:hypothetical protein
VAHFLRPGRGRRSRLRFGFQRVCAPLQQLHHVDAAPAACLAGRRAYEDIVARILIWTRGGTSHHGTFDPKPDASVSVRGKLDVGDTAVPKWPCVNLQHISLKRERRSRFLMRVKLRRLEPRRGGLQEPGAKPAKPRGGRHRRAASLEGAA